MNLQHILLTTDLSDESVRSFEPIGRLAAEAGAKITLLFVAQAHEEAFVVGIESPVVTSDFGEVEAVAKASMEKLASSLPSGVQVDHVVTHGRDVAREIVETAEKAKADLIGISTHGRSGFRRMVMGSTAENVIRRARVPVVVFPAGDPG